MEREKIEYIVAGVLVVVFIFFLLNPPKKKPKKRASLSAVKSESVQNFTKVLNQHENLMKEKIDTQGLKELAAKYDTVPVLRDPFAFLVRIEKEEEIVEIVEEVVEEVPETLEPPPDFQIQGVLYNSSSPNDSVAIVFGEEKTVGSQVMGWTIASIRENRIVFQKDGRSHAINLY